MQGILLQAQKWWCCVQRKWCLAPWSREPLCSSCIYVPFRASRVPAKVCKAVKLPETSVRLDVPQEPMTKGRCILSWKGDFWCCFSASQEALRSVTCGLSLSLLSSPTASAFTSASTGETSSAGARKPGYPGDRNGWTADKSESVIALGSMALATAA